VSDEPDRSGTAGDDGETAEVDATGARSQTAVVSRPVTGPLRPTGKRSRARAAAAEENGDTDTVVIATQPADSGSEAATEKLKKIQKGKKKSEGPSRNPFVFVLNYLKQVVAELRKVIWPNRKQMITYTGVVLAFLVFMTALIAGSDYGFAKLVLLVFGE
jgi:preprotein translocase subunit SecE